MTTFRSPKGVFYYQVMPLSLKNDRAIYQRAMIAIFKEMCGVMVECYIDYLVVKSRQRINHLEHLKIVFDKLCLHQMKMNLLSAHSVSP